MEANQLLDLVLSTPVSPKRRDAPAYQFVNKYSATLGAHICDSTNGTQLSQSITTGGFTQGQAVSSTAGKIDHHPTPKKRQIPESPKVALPTFGTLFVCDSNIWQAAPDFDLWPPDPAYRPDLNDAFVTALIEHFDYQRKKVFYTLPYGYPEGAESSGDSFTSPVTSLGWEVKRVPIGAEIKGPFYLPFLTKPIDDSWTTREILKLSEEEILTLKRVARTYGLIVQGEWGNPIPWTEWNTYISKALGFPIQARGSSPFHGFGWQINPKSRFFRNRKIPDRIWTANSSSIQTPIHLPDEVVATSLTTGLPTVVYFAPR